MHRSILSSAAVLTILLSNAVAHADEEPAPPAPAPVPAAAPEAARPKISIAIERAGGVGYTRIFAKDSDAAVSFTAFAVGGLFVNPYAAPRVGVDYIFDSGITLGAAASIGHYSLSGTSTSTTTVVSNSGATPTTTTTSKDQDVGSLFLYTLAPRVGYRIPLSEHVDLTPRGGITLAGGSVSSGTSDDSFGVFAVALSGEGVLAYRMTPSFNLLAGGSADYTVAATASQSSSSGNGSSSSSQDIKGGVLTLQAWLGLGGYL